MKTAKEQFAVMEMFKIKKTVLENDSNKTFYLDKFIFCKPGQFAMVWIPGVDEKPFSVMNVGKESALNLELKGKWSKKFFELKEGDFVGIRGPFGTPFQWEKTKKACIVAGGVGVVPLFFLAEEFKSAGIKTTFILGAKSSKKLLFEKQISRIVSKFIVTTDDGSEGRHGFVTAALMELLSKEKFDRVYTCGPEKMMHNVFKECEKAGVLLSASLERFMKCGIGICGACMVNDRIACIDGPVFESEELRKMGEFGKTFYLKSGKKCSLEEFYRWKSP
ncbi:MAG: dihydroorotate dehydrogenase electron transfer subunit [Candidatus Diapherotrites archaeon]|nr:dihydroorotate dehydrogenase electron transfer subunit [Candidatus Diapherotrites archaeon]